MIFNYHREGLFVWVFVYFLEGWPGYNPLRRPFSTMWLGTLCVCTLHHFNRQNVMTRLGGGGSSKNPPKISSLDVVSHKCKSHIISVSGHCVRFILKRLSNCCSHNTLWCFGSYADIGNWELHLHESHFNKKPYFYQYYLSYKVSICENVWILGKIFHFLVHKRSIKVAEIFKIIFFS